MVRIARLERWAWYAFLATLAWQTRIILWPGGLPFNEWRAGAFWFSDALMLGLFLVAVAQGFRVRPGLDSSRRGGRFDRLDVVVAALVGVAALSLAGAGDPGVGAYQLVRLAQYALFFLYLRHWAFRRFDADRSVAVFVAGAVVQAGIGIGQYVLQHDLGLRLIGETLLRTDMRGVAVFYDLAGEKVLRAYGTLPHPNILGTYLGLALWGLAWLWLRHGGAKGEKRIANSVWLVSGTLLMWGFAATFARTVIAAWAVATLVIVIAVFVSRFSARWPNIAMVRRRFIAALALCAVAGTMFLIVAWPQVAARLTIHSSDEAVQLRLAYARDALASGGGGSWLARINWLGVGIGNFTTWLRAYDPTLPSYLVQPAHSVYLMAYAETGVLGLAGLTGVLVAAVWRARHSWAAQPLLRVGILAALAAVLAVASFDHFFWTLQQGRILWWLTLAVAAGRS